METKMIKTDEMKEVVFGQLSRRIIDGLPEQYFSQLFPVGELKETGKIKFVVVQGYGVETTYPQVIIALRKEESSADLRYMGLVEAVVSAHSGPGAYLGVCGGKIEIKEESIVIYEQHVDFGNYDIDLIKPIIERMRDKYFPHHSIEYK